MHQYSRHTASAIKNWRVACRARRAIVVVRAEDKATLDLNEGVEGGTDYSGILAGERPLPAHQSPVEANYFMLLLICLVGGGQAACGSGQIEGTIRAKRSTMLPVRYMCAALWRPGSPRAFSHLKIAIKSTSMPAERMHCMLQWWATAQCTSATCTWTAACSSRHSLATRCSTPSSTSSPAAALARRWGPPSLPWRPSLVWLSHSISDLQLREGKPMRPHAGMWRLLTGPILLSTELCRIARASA